MYSLAPHVDNCLCLVVRVHRICSIGILKDWGFHAMLSELDRNRCFGLTKNYPYIVYILMSNCSNLMWLLFCWNFIISGEQYGLPYLDVHQFAKKMLWRVWTWVITVSVGDEFFFFFCLPMYGREFFLFAVPTTHICHCA